ncbi:5-formyltetrahydrofolate cyclo-ligase [Mesorhizobium sp. M4A.F.Ca.ET.020.02.1.1]|uniref:5-formyltetrahydrofolate cyclo-ligase n=1 Tax=unclassified Mesorhizobium TaxID=325217 RepID=UPI000FC9E23F|nr:MULTISPECIES: 5-formyltetrahydrofolate cyclo-ligase [unclassified Mesorhizobium]RUX43324.1 5-formyltetrahydrofolate cyclo-ligase [Mesorhizobium sp. M4A.F.Ca.ET.050.02.1.1]RVC74247.1 5-formyltetrahydrofolate cyclo-ligase [Mesorhizobium sp. M4A.F.Ca.ET.022.05.2.1]RVD36054.1 5-formyltetrahydrofolate cyclo-ligase [Mesorhizobium sp. M4A.F.Ca.ET.020.02.1.1]RWC13301.1 MAG: 5-formyltetrahydrofolate cyclo-ligase [Mesorhizobium sp.]RWD33289.1 MAG: 5-formyltetrahydrofolate cyclo-ligase [Mesorhizobium 
MADDRDEQGPAQYASPPCFMHELDPEFRVPLTDWSDVRRWRKAERERLIAARLAVSADARAAMSTRIAVGLDALVGDIGGRMVSLYWPFRGEPDLRPWMASINERGGRTALPVVIEKGQPLVFRAYRPGDRLEKGVWNIPIPAEGDPVLPDIVISPIVGIDPGKYRLGYGGGFFDRTLAAMPFRPLVIGVGYELQRIPTIYPQPHDIPMSKVVTEAAGA